MTNNIDVFGYPKEALTYNLEVAKKVVSDKLNPSWIEQRTQGKATLSYIGGHIVIRLLNQAFNYQWSFEVIKEEIIPSLPKPLSEYKNGRRQPVLNPDGSQKMEPQPPVVKVLGRLTVPGLGVKEQYGSKVLIGGATEQESAFKSASTDALKKCASLFGIGLDLYGEAEGLEQQLHDQAMDNTAVQPTPPVQSPRPQTKAPTPAQTVNPTQSVNNEAPIQEPQVDINQFQRASEVAPQPTPEPQQQGGGTVLNSQPQQQEQQAQTSTGAVHQMAWPPAEVTKMIDLKKQLQITNNAELNPFIQEWLNNAEVTSQNITPENIAAFNVFLQGKLQ